MKILIPFAEGFEEIEAITCVDVLRRADINVITASLKGNVVEGAHKVEIVTDLSLIDVNTKELNGIVLPGGMPGSINLQNSNEIINIIKELYQDNKLIAAICAAPIVLEKSGVINGRFVTCYPGIEKELKSARYCNDRIVVDENIITGKGPGAALEFAVTIVKHLLGNDKAKMLMKSMITMF